LSNLLFIHGHVEFQCTIVWAITWITLFSTNVYLRIAYEVHMSLIFNRNGKNRPKIMTMFLTCVVQAGGSWYSPRLHFVGVQYLFSSLYRLRLFVYS
jgi:hypothetical protein